ncbi:MAG: LAGLIDADG family homing endonuclease [Nanoarchaeota archaeon]
MKRLSFDTKENISSLIKNGKSLGEICTLLNLNKTTVYYYIKKIRGRKINPVVLNLSDSEVIGEFMGVFAGDGYYFYDKKRYKGKIRITFNRKEEKLVNYYAYAISKIISKKPRLYYLSNIIILEITCKELSNLLKEYLMWEEGNKTYTIGLSLNKKSLSKKFIKGFVRGLIDSDGYVRKDRLEIYFGTTSTNLLNDIKKGFDTFKIDYKVYKQQRDNREDFYKLRISGEEVLKCCNIFKPLKADGLMV